MEVETLYLQRPWPLLPGRSTPGMLARLGLELPVVDRHPAPRFDEAKGLAAEKYSYPIRTFDLGRRSPSASTPRRSGAATSCSSPITPASAPFYAMDDPADPRYTLSFDLLFRGMEVTTGGQRIHDYQQIVDKMRPWMDPRSLRAIS